MQYQNKILCTDLEEDLRLYAHRAKIFCYIPLLRIMIMQGEQDRITVFCCCYLLDIFTKGQWRLDELIDKCHINIYKDRIWQRCLDLLDEYMFRCLLVNLKWYI